MIRQIIHIDEETCNGCGLCAKACHERAIAMVNGKAKLIRDDYCDGLGDCLPNCPTGAITFETREAAPYDKAAVEANMAASKSMLRNWPVQMKLAPIKAPYFNNASLLIAADCTAFSYRNFHKDFIQDCAVLIGCPKLDAIDYSNKLTEIIRNNTIKDIHVVRMEVPCCGGLEFAVKKALAGSGKSLPLKVTTLSIDGKILD